ncbi:hypothetical protein [Aquimarina sp. AU474]|uniref:hypothetical protein n=1 Tax=Aquimarina sp. AU474 TaxID=2108529 RepID=UPI000D697104|nr:hypothetical protein [Aquimarina sp. AU474]
MIRITLIFVFVSLFVSTAISQSATQEYKDIPEEKIFMHHNTSFLFTGEYLYYSVYCLNSESRNLSDLSKVAYVELVSEDKKVVFTHKVKLKNGVGQGDFFLPVSLRSGNYKLLAYTNWMKNYGVQNFFQGDVAIVNPYQGDQKSILTDSVSYKEKREAYLKERIKSDRTKSKISLTTNKSAFGKREAVDLKIRNLDKSIAGGRFSISVRKVDTIKTPNQKTTLDFNTSLSKRNEQLKSESVTLPELRGELICGKIISKDSNFDVVNKKVGFSIPGENYEIKIATTDNEGGFCFNLDREYEENDGFLQVLGFEDKFNVELIESEVLDYEKLNFNDFKITREMKDMIIKRSVYNQIRNRYFSVKPDTLTPLQEIPPFYEGTAEIYNLDDYTRFPTIRETLVEVVNNVWAKKVENDRYVFQVRYKYPPFNEPEYLPLVIVDGMIIQDHTDLVEYDARKVKRISVSRDKHYLGSQIFQGIVDIETEKGDYYTLVNKSYIDKITLFKPLPKKKYFVQQYNQGVKSDSDRIPDFRNQLLWLPDVTFDDVETTINFFTSNNLGDYEIRIEGYSSNGMPISATERITVK